MDLFGAYLPASASNYFIFFLSSLLFGCIQRVALETAGRLLKPAGAGTLAVADFFLSGGEKDDRLRGLWRAARWLEMTAQRLWFKQVGGLHIAPICFGRSITVVHTP